MRWRKGQGARFTATYRVGGTPTDGTPTAYVTAPDGTRTAHAEPEVSHAGDGVYSLDVALDQAGEWGVRWEFAGPGDYVGASELGVLVEPSDFS